MGKLRNAFVFFLATSGSILPHWRVVAQIDPGRDADGTPPYGTGYADDVIVDLAWTDEVPDFEGEDIAPPAVDPDPSTPDPVDPVPDLRRRYLHHPAQYGQADGLEAPASDLSERFLHNYEPAELDPSLGPPLDVEDELFDDAGFNATDLGRRAQNFYLRIMPLGASITEGVGSSDGNGYRKWLRSQLRWKGWQVNMVGSKQNGNMADKDNEGHPRWIISQVHHNAFLKSVWMMPNLVIINVGTNDCSGQIDTGNAGVRMKAMIDDIFRLIPGVTVILTTLARSRNHDACAFAVSSQYRNVVSSYPSGTRIALADLYAEMLHSELHPDGIHPNDAGFKVFAGIIWRAIRTVEAGIQPPVAVPGIDDSATTGPAKCNKIAGKARGPVQTQQGSGHQDGNYVHASTARGIITSARIQKNADTATQIRETPRRIFFANLVVSNPNFDRKTALDDWIRIYKNAAGNNEYYVRMNQGNGVFGSSVRFYVDMTCNGPAFAFADFNNDGLDDFFCIKNGASVWVSLNRGGNPPVFESIGEVVPNKYDGSVSGDVRIADIDGDGRADFCLTKPDATVVCSRNGGVGDNFFWQGFTTAKGIRGRVFGLKNGVNTTGIRFGDMNGDFRADYLYVGDQGQVETWTNTRWNHPSILPQWRLAGTTHVGMGVPGIRDRIKFGRIYGSGRLDYIYIEEKSTYFDVKIWENQGSGGTRRRSDGNFYCDMRGTGSDDYVWIWSHGQAAEFYANVHSPPNWGHSATISISVPGPREAIHVADWNGDGKCDILVQNKATGALTLYSNYWNPATQHLSFQNHGVVTGAATCTQGWGVGFFDRGMRLADIDGDGRADVLCIEPNGRVTAWLNTASGMVNVGQVKKTEGWDRANIRFADVEGSGRADMIWLNKYNGAATVMKNNGHMNGGHGSSFSWTARGVLYSSVGGRGENMHFANLNGLGRADLMWVIPSSNLAYTYFNECPGTSGGDDGPVSYPGLPGGDIPDNPNAPGPDPNPIHIPVSPLCTSSYETLDAIYRNIFYIPEHCAPIYAVSALWNQFTSTMNTFNQLKQNYDSKWGYYQDFVKDLINPRLAKWMNNWELDDEKKIGGGNRFFSCQFKFKDSDTNWVYQGSCPVPHHIMDSGEFNEDPRYAYGSWVIRYTLQDQTGFEAALINELGIMPEWVKWEDWDSVPDPDCSRGFADECTDYHQWVRGHFPRQADNVVIPNPKTILDQAMDQFLALKHQFLAAALGLGTMAWDTSGGKSGNDAIIGLGMPVMLLAQAVENMAQIKDIGAQIEEKERTQKIMFIVSMVLLIVPFVAELGLAFAGFAAIARLAALGGEIAGVGVAIADIVLDPTSAPLAIMGLLVGVVGRGRRAEDVMADAKVARLAMTSTHIASMGRTYKALDDKVQAIVNRCSR
ncbi:integrin alpha N-terminal [Podospora aff. communis PSN243]|uniref:Integrin alpha N-terminal n=1 Tax=Podospora aff. communis PSN243 TaxID=3040156 RepID=A0AAV9GN89_9PEZI|nr:integrin alpha N-terminal [Podospora aff. communis PSN243]